MGSSKGPDAFDAIAEEQIKYIRKGIKQFEERSVEAQGKIDEGVTTARGDIQGYADAGSAAMDMYSGLLGMSSAEDNEKAFESYMASPFQRVVQNDLEAAGKEVARKAAGSGLLNSGNFAAALQDRTQEVSQRGLGEFANRLGSIANQGQEAAKQQGIFSMGGAQQNSDILRNLGTAQSNAQTAIGAASSGALANRFQYEMGLFNPSAMIGPSAGKSSGNLFGGIPSGGQ